MKRRDLVGVLGGKSLAWPVMAWAQSAEKRRRIALVHSGVPIERLTEAAGSSAVQQFFAELRRFGYAEGRGFTVERYSAEGRSDRYADLAALVVRTAPDVIVTNTSDLTRVFAPATTTSPIVALTADPIESGLVSSLARPRGQSDGGQHRSGSRHHAQALADPEGGAARGRQGHLLEARHPDRS